MIIVDKAAVSRITLETYHIPRGNQAMYLGVGQCLVTGSRSPFNKGRVRYALTQHSQRNLLMPWLGTHHKRRRIVVTVRTNGLCIRDHWLTDRKMAWCFYPAKGLLTASSNVRSTFEKMKHRPSTAETTSRVGLTLLYGNPKDSAVHAKESHNHAQEAFFSLDYWPTISLRWSLPFPQRSVAS